jgi:rare lipoprotein A (peptidoglycan hydrolase)
MLLKLRRDFKEQQGASYSQRAFHDRLLANGTATFAAHRQLMLGDSAGDLLE